IMLPGITISPPNFLTPSRLPALSRPLRDEPPAFLCAILNLLRRRLLRRRCPGAAPRRRCFLPGQPDLGDLQHGLMLAMAVLAPVVLPPLFLEHDDLVGAALLDQGGADRGTVEQRRAGRDAGAVADHQHLAELERGAGFAIELLDGDHIVLGDRVLLAAGADHCKHNWTDIGWRARRGKPRLGKRGPGRPPRPGAAHYSCAPRPVNVFGPLEPVRDVARTARLDSGPYPPPLAGGRSPDCHPIRPRPIRRGPGGRHRSGPLWCHCGSRPERQSVVAE